MKEYRGAACTLIGRRTRNQDNFLLNGQILPEKHGNDAASAAGLLEGPIFAAVVDGAGTKTTGETASELVCRHLWDVREKFEEVNDLSEVAEIINEALAAANLDIESVMEDEPTSKMGATAAVLLIYNGRAIFGNVGDSAVYLRRDGVMQKLTCDHTEGEELIARGALTREMLKNHSSKSKVTRKIGYMSFGRTDIMQFYDVIDVKDTDVFVLASPGVVQFMTPDDIDKGLQTCVDISKSAERVAKAAFNEFDSKDNITVLALRINEQVDTVGNKNAKIKPISSGGGVKVRTSLEIDPEIIKRIIYILIIAVILSVAAVYAIKTFPKDEMLTHVNQPGYTWGDTHDNTEEDENDSYPTGSESTDDESGKDDTEKSDDSDSDKDTDVKDSDDSGKSEDTESSDTSEKDD